MKIKFWNLNNVIVSLKAIGSSIISSLILIIPYMIAVFLINDGNIIIGRIIQSITFLSNILIWGWISRKLWNWK